MNKLFTLKKPVLLIILVFLSSQMLFAQYNNLWIPDTLSGTTFNLNIKDTFSQIRPGQQTITAGINNKFWGPTLFVNKGDTVHMNVRNYLNDSTTLHWHGMHLPAVMDGGPHQVIPPGTLWQPYWKVANNAATYWYHPHLHEMTQEQMTKGIGGLIIVRDSIESSLSLPRKYGIDDIPLVLTDRDFTTANQFSVVPYGDSSMVNGVLSPQFTIPSQVVRFRILNAAIERSYNLGFSDNRTFYVITSDGGLLNAPVSLTRYLLHAGERVEILVNCAGQSGTSINLKAYNSTLSQQTPGGDVFPNGPFANALARIDFNVLHLNIGTQTSNPITAIPTVLTIVNTIPEASASITRYLTISDTTIAGIQGAAFLLNHRLFNINYNNYSVPLNNTEIWQITNSGNFGHPFHIHDVEFNILSLNGVAPATAQAGWKDVVYVPSQSTVRFIAKFDDYADNIHPFMFHCHISLHEDEGMMGQFIVGSSAVSPAVSSLNCTGASFSNSAMVGVVYSGTASVPYTGGNGVAYTLGTTVNSTGVTGLTATLQAGVLANGTGTAIFSISGTPSAAGTANFSIALEGQSCTLSLTVNNTLPTIPTITSLSCNAATFSASATVNTAYSGTATVSYTGGNGLAYTIGTSILSTGVTGLTATLQSGILANGSGSVTYSVVGTPLSVGTANFAISVGGQSCTLSLTINNVGPVLPAISSLLCNTATLSAIAYANIVFSGTAAVPYTGGNGALYPVPGPSVVSTGVEGLTAIIQPGTLASGGGSLNINITGTPASTGVASFMLDFGGQTCTLNINITSNSSPSSVFDFTVVPNPVKSVLNLKFASSDTKVYYVWIYDAIGRNVLMIPRPNPSNCINVSSLPKGAYMIKVMEETNKKTLTKKFVKG